MEKKEVSVCERTDCKFHSGMWQNKCAALSECYEDARDCKFYKKREVKDAENN